MTVKQCNQKFEVFGNYLRIYIVLCKILKQLWHFFRFWTNFFVVNGQILK